MPDRDLFTLPRPQLYAAKASTEATKRQPAPSSADRLQKARDALEKAEVATTPRRRGRPNTPKPWEDAGVSRMTWYRWKIAGKLP